MLSPPLSLSGQPHAGAWPAAVVVGGTGGQLVVVRRGKGERAGEDAAADGPARHRRPRVDAPRQVDRAHGGDVAGEIIYRGTIQVRKNLPSTQF